MGSRKLTQVFFFFFAAALRNQNANQRLVSEHAAESAQKPLNDIFKCYLRRALSFTLRLSPTLSLNNELRTVGQARSDA